MSEVFKNLSEGGGYSVNHLLRLSNIAESENIYISDNNEDLVFDDILYKASNFTYSANVDGSANLQVELIREGNSIINLIENNTEIKAEVVTLFIKGSEAILLSTHHHRYGKVTWNGESASFTFEKDDRLNMTFPALVWNRNSDKGETNG